MEKNTFSKAIETKISKKYPEANKVKIEENDYYSHPTYYIENIWDYIHLVTLISSIDPYEFCDTVIYRGTSDSSYQLLPGLARLNYKDVENITEEIEYELINEFFTRRPDAFSGLSDFDVLAKMQHYGLPTRLLDFSTNPLVALYFACEDKPKTDGRVVCHNTFLQNDSSYFINSICKAAISKPFDECYFIEDYLCDGKLSLRRYLSEAYLHTETTVVRPKYWNQRIANQSGVFMVFPNDLRDRYRRIFISSKDKGLSEAIKEYGIGRCNEDIVKEVFDKEPIDFYIEENLSSITDECFKKMYYSHDVDKTEDKWDDFQKFFTERFFLDLALKKINKQRIRNDFCSIIIKGKDKAKILEELAYVGITTDYIYPELEYTAKEIKRKFHI